MNPVKNKFNQYSCYSYALLVKVVQLIVSLRYNKKALRL